MIFALALPIERRPFSIAERLAWLVQIILANSICPKPSLTRRPFNKAPAFVCRLVSSLKTSLAGMLV